MIEGISVREFAKREGCNDKVVRRKIKSGHLNQLPNGKLDPALIGSGWRVRSDADEPAEVSAPGVRTVRTVRSVRTHDEQPEAIVADHETAEEAADRIVNVEGRAPFSKAEAERIKENYLALLRQLEYDRESGKVAEIADVVQAVVEEYALIRNRVLNIASRVSPRAAVLRSPEEVKALIDEEVALVLEELTLDADDSGTVRERFGRPS